MVAQSTSPVSRLAIVLLMLILTTGLATAASGVQPLEPGAGDSTPHWRVLSHDTDSMRLEFSLGAFHVDEIDVDGETWQALTIEGGAIQGDDGAPGLPTVGRLVAVPRGATISGRVVGQEMFPLPSLRLFPVQPGHTASFFIDRAVYNAKATAPALQIGEPAIMAGRTVVPVTVSPLVYDAAARTGEAARTIEIEITFTGGKPDTRPVAASFDGWMRENVTGYVDKSFGGGSLPGTYVLVRHGNSQITSRVATLQAWRERQGYHVEIVDVDVVGNNTSSIKSALQSIYDNTSIPPLEFVTLVGDEDGTYGVETWREGLSGYNGPGDHYYANLDGGDVLADVHLGRLSFETLDELDIIVAKILNYEQTPPMDDTSWYGRASLMGDPGQSGITTIYVNQWLKGHLESLGWAQVDTCWGGNFQSAFYGTVNPGTSLFGYRGYLGMSGISQSTIGNLTNGGRLPVALLPTCDTGTISYNECHSEAMLRSTNGGAIAAVGTATQGTHTRYNNCYYQGTWNGLLYNADHRIGVAHTLGKLELYLGYQVAEANVVEVWSVWNTLLGDPATDIWLGVPEYITVDHPASLPPGASTVPVTVTSGGQPLADVVVCVYRDGEFMVSALTDASGSALLPVPDLTSGSVLVTVSGHGYLPYLGSLSVGAVNDYCGLEDISIDGDGVVNPGESIALGVELRNEGTDPAIGVTATLGEGVPFGSVVSGALAFGDIAAGSTAWATGPAQVTIAAEASDGTVIAWPLAVSAGGDTWHSVVQTTVSAADFTVAGTTWTGPGFGPDPGESGNLVLDLDNGGSLGATAISATVSTDSPWVIINAGTSSFGDIPAAGSGDNAASPFEFTIASDCYQGHLAALDVVLTYSGGMQQTLEYVMSVGTSVSNAPMGPDAYGYYAYDDTDTGSGLAPVYDWIAIDPDNGGPGADLGLSDFGWEQDDTRTIDLPFTFGYYGQDYDRVSICSNGWMAMGEMNLLHYRNFGIPSAGSPGAMIAPFWDNLYQTGNNKVYTWYDESGHRFVVQWFDMPNDYSNSTQNFEVVLYDPQWHQTSTGDGMILFQYETVANTDSRDGYATVGIQNVERTDGLMYTFWNTYGNAAAPLAAGRAILFTPLGDVVHPVADVTPGTFATSAESGAQATEYLHIGNTGEAGSTLNYTVTAVDPLTRSGAKNLPGGGDAVVLPTNLTGSDVKLNASQYEPGTSVVLDMAATCISNDWEWVVFVTLDLPSGVTVDMATDMPTNHNTMQWNDATGDGALCTWGNGSQSGGYLDNQEVGHADISLTFDAALTGDVEIAWSLDGDQYGSDPHHVSGTIILAPTDPAIFVTAPNSGLVAVLGTTLDVDFQAVNGPETATIELQREAAGSWETLATGVSLAAGSWPWTVTGDPGPYAVFRVTDELDPLVFGLSGVFAVGRNMDWLQIGTPTGQVAAGTSVDVTLTLDATGLVDGVYEADLDVTHNGGATVVVPVQFTVGGSVGVDTLPARVALLGAHPNPFNPQTMISFALPSDMPVSLKVYSAEGKLVRTLLSDRQPAGTHRVLWDGRDGSGRAVASGVYLYRLVTPEGAVSGKAALLK
jgi:hypothetical protein